jgi:hypothetical protein
MPRFYFHLRDDLDVNDEEGVEFAGFAEAREHALSQARFTAAETIKEQGKIVAHHRIDIGDESRRTLDSIYFSDAVTIDC